MLITMRLYSKTELDLCVLCNNDAGFKKKVSRLLTQYVQGEILEYDNSEISTDISTMLNDVKQPNFHEIYLHISTNDKAVIELMNGMRYGYRGEFIKQLIRYSLKKPILNCFLYEKGSVAKAFTKKTKIPLQPKPEPVVEQKPVPISIELDENNNDADSNVTDSYNANPEYSNYDNPNDNNTNDEDEDAIFRGLLDNLICQY